MNRIITLLASLLFTCSLIAQLSGTIENTDGEKMAYTSVYVMGSSIGTTTNMEGYYELKLSPGQYKIIFQYVGYESVTKDVNIGQARLVLNITLDVQSLLLDEIIIAADSEDKAYVVIRKAIEKREYYKNKVESYSCDVYVKGNNKILQAPEKILGVEVGDLEGQLDSNRQGIVYLSESVSELYFKQPNEYKEIVTSSKISGNDRGYSFNSAKEMDFNIYTNSIELNRAIVSPIANNALRYYDYRLEGTYYDSERRLINQIAVIPKRGSDPTFFGTIYIIEDLWLVHSFSLSLTGKSSQLYFIDTLTFDQIFVPIEEPDVWRLFNNTISFKFSGFGFVMAGKFTAIYSNYVVNPVFTKNFFNSVTHQVEKESNKRDSSYWESVRPVPLTIEEIKDYNIKDSIFLIRDSEAYKDSLDRERNKVDLGIVLGGYSHQNTLQHQYWNISSPVSSLLFNTVQGINSRIDIGWRKYFDDEETKRLLLSSSIDYGFSERKLRAFASLTYRSNRISSTQFSIFGGSKIEQFNNQEPISQGFNNLYSLLLERNYAKYYGKDFFGAAWRTDLSSGVVLNTSISWENRHSLDNNSDWVIWNHKNREYTSNNPLRPTDFTPFFENHQALIIGASTNIKIGQKYTLFPDRRYNEQYNGPNIKLGYKGALKALGGDVNFHQLDAGISQSVEIGVAGQLDYYVNGGVFFHNEEMQFVDYQHFMGNEILFANKADLGQRFFLLSYYNRSTSDQYAQIHLQHHFNGWILDKLPGINKSGFSLVVGAKYLYVGDNANYTEIHLGLDKIGWHFFRALRVDIIAALENKSSRWGTRIGLGF